MTFRWQTEHWPTVAEFAAHLARHERPPWCRMVVLHHTWVPTVAQWSGRRSMDGLRDYYAGLGWEAGPHLFVAPDGIWQGSPMDRPGVHANAANPRSIGVEVVGDYDPAPWAEPIRSLALGTLDALLSWLGLTPADIAPHRQFNPKKSCPGRAIVMDEVRAALSAPRYTPASPLLGSPLGTVSQAIDWLTPRSTNYDAAAIEEIVGAYARLGAASGVDWFLALAQCAHETGNLTSALSARRDKYGNNLRNSAGIGVTGESSPDARPGFVWDADRELWRACVGFARWDPDAAQAHLGRLVAYALPPGQRFGWQVTAADYALKVRGLPLALQGSAPTVGDLGGKWAPSPSYGERIVARANEMMGI